MAITEVGGLYPNILHAQRRYGSGRWGGPGLAGKNRSARSWRLPVLVLPLDGSLGVKSKGIPPKMAETFRFGWAILAQVALIQVKDL